RRFSSSNSFNRARSSISSGFSLKSPRFFAAFIQFPNVPSLIPRSRAISAIGLPELINNSTASALNSGVNFRRVEPITVLLLVDNHSTSVTVYGSDRPPVAHLGDPAEIAGLRGPKKRAKTDRADARLLRTLLVEGRFPESWIPPAHVVEVRTLGRLYCALMDERRAWQQRIHAQLFHQGCPPVTALLSVAGRDALAGAELSGVGRQYVDTALRRIDELGAEIVPLRAQLV